MLLTAVHTKGLENVENEELEAQSEEQSQTQLVKTPAPPRSTRKTRGTHTHTHTHTRAHIPTLACKQCRYGQQSCTCTGPPDANENTFVSLSKHESCQHIFPHFPQAFAMRSVCFYHSPFLYPYHCLTGRVKSTIPEESDLVTPKQKTGRRPRKVIVFSSDEEEEGEMTML